MLDPTCTPPAENHDQALAELDTAVHVAREMLAAYGSTDYADPAAVAQAFGATRESLRILLRALGRAHAAEGGVTR
ncbi:hypothetical protein AB0D90_15560 [Streptomyces althioticus]|uniref:hypothetical protein n=1 Tax=Streptomyces althioticus TaxID=83380 RepID=UPI0033F8395F